LERFQAIQNKQGSTMRYKLRQSFALLPRGSDPWIWISKPSESGVKKFICGGSLPAAALSVFSLGQDPNAVSDSALECFGRGKNLLWATGAPSLIIRSMPLATSWASPLVV
jgi:hypothetical protein